MVCSTKRRRIDRDVFNESRKPVYANSDLYDVILSDENEETYLNPKIDSDFFLRKFLLDLNFQDWMKQLWMKFYTTVIRNLQATELC